MSSIPFSAFIDHDKHIPLLSQAQFASNDGQLLVNFSEAREDTTALSKDPSLCKETYSSIIHTHIP